jgi:hypothetical protein
MYKLRPSSPVGIKAFVRGIVSDFLEIIRYYARCFEDLRENSLLDLATNGGCFAVLIVRRELLFCFFNLHNTPSFSHHLAVLINGKHTWGSRARMKFPIRNLSISITIYPFHNDFVSQVAHFNNLSFAYFFCSLCVPIHIIVGNDLRSTD